MATSTKDGRNGGVYGRYLWDVGLLLKEWALDAKRSSDMAKAGGDSAEIGFQGGRAIAYFEVVASMQKLALEMEIPLEDLQLEDIDPFEELL